ncbi:MAG: flagellar motor protein MotB [Deltaproteobacteria bacterium]
MSGRNSGQPIIIKKRKIVKGGGHHGGAWKVAYADFVTAMMAFFMLMWLLNATTEKQRKGIADYFSPTIPISRISGGGDGSFGGDSVFTEDSLAQTGTGSSGVKLQAGGAPTAIERDAAAKKGVEKQDGEAFTTVEAALTGKSGESMVSAELARHIIVKLTDEGLVIELFDTEDTSLFKQGSAEPEKVARDLTEVLARVFTMVSNDVAVNGHVSAQPIVVIDNPVWDLSSERARTIRALISDSGLPEDRFMRISGFADRKLADPNPMALRNNRIEVILLRTKT